MKSTRTDAIGTAASPVPAAGSHAQGGLAPAQAASPDHLTALGGHDPGTRSGGEPPHSKETRPEPLL
jgi:hypothetical protein